MSRLNILCLNESDTPFQFPTQKNDCQLRRHSSLPQFINHYSSINAFKRHSIMERRRFFPESLPSLFVVPFASKFKHATQHNTTCTTISRHNLTRFGEHFYRERETLPGSDSGNGQGSQRGAGLFHERSLHALRY